MAERPRRQGRAQLIDQPTKTANSRTVRLDAATVGEIEAQRAGAGGGPALHVLDRRRPCASVGGGLEPEHASASTRSGGCTTCATGRRRWRLAAGADVRTVAGRLGHANPAMTLRVYAHALEAADQAVATTLGDVLDGAANPAPHGKRGVGQSKGMDVLARLGADRQAIAGFCRRNGIRRLAVFGSALRDDFTPESDVDLLAEFEPGQVPGMFRISGMELELEEKIFHGRRVDLRTAAELGRRFRDRVVAEAEPVYDVAA